MQIIVQNLATEYQDQGKGPVMLFLHGWQDSLETFNGLIDEMPSGWRMVRFDLPGFGKSEAPQTIWDLDDYVQFVKDFIEKLNLKVETLVGHSFGGRIILKGVATGDLQPHRIILIDSAGVSRKRPWRNLAFKILAKTGRLVVYLPPLVFWRQQLKKKMYHLAGSDYLTAGDLKKTFLKIIAENLSSSAKKITVPTLLIWGENDSQTPLADGRYLSQLIVGSKLEIIKSARHFVHQEQPKQIARLIQNFYD